MSRSAAAWTARASLALQNHRHYSVKPYVTSLINPSGLAVDVKGDLFVSCRHDGTIHRVTPDGQSEQ